jgi:hypothetical protein
MECIYEVAYFDFSARGDDSPGWQAIYQQPSLHLSQSNCKNLMSITVS